MLYLKTILQTHTGHTLIRYAKSKYRLLFRLLHAPTRNELHDQIMAIADELEDELPEVYYHITSSTFNGDYYALMLIEMDNLENMSIQSFQKTLEKSTRRLLQWYLYAYLIPVLENREPFTNTEEDENDTD